MKKINNFFLSLTVILGGYLSAGAAINNNLNETKNVQINNETKNEDENKFTQLDFFATSTELEVKWNNDEYGGAFQKTETKIEVEDITNVDEPVFVMVNNWSTLKVDEDSGLIEDITINNYPGGEPIIEGNKYQATITFDYYNSKDATAKIISTDTVSKTVIAEGKKRNQYVENTFLIKDNLTTSHSFVFSFNILTGEGYDSFSAEDNVKLKINNKNTSLEEIPDLSKVSIEDIDDNVEKITMKASNLQANTQYEGFKLSLNKGDEDELFENIPKDIASVHTLNNDNPYKEESFIVPGEKITEDSFEFNFVINQGEEYEDFVFEDISFKYGDNEFDVEEVNTIDNADGTETIFAKAINLKKGTTYDHLTFSTDGSYYIDLADDSGIDPITTKGDPVPEPKDNEYIDNSFKILKNKIADHSFQFEIKVHSGGDYKDFDVNNVVLKSNDKKLTLDSEASNAKDEKTFILKAIDLEAETEYSNFTLSINGEKGDFSTIDPSIKVSTNEEGKGEDGDGLSAGAIVGIVIGVIVLLIIIILAILMILKSSKNKQKYVKEDIDDYIS